MTEILNIQELETVFQTREGTIHAVNGVSFRLEFGESLGIVGESGSGKSVTMLSILRLLQMPPGKILSGKAYYNGEDLFALTEEKIRQLRGSKIGMIFQDPMTSLNPVLTIERQISEVIIEHLGISEAEAKVRAIELLNLVGIPDPSQKIEAYPHHLSGGMRQRVMIAIALACNPQVLIADEPTTALDVTIQAQIIGLVKKLQSSLGMTVIWITHDLAVAFGIVDRIIVMYGGTIVENATKDELYHKPLHPYTIGILNCIPTREKNLASHRLASIPGSPPILYEKPEYCPFAPRCPYVFEKCVVERPPLFFENHGHQVACWLNISDRSLRKDNRP